MSIDLVSARDVAAGDRIVVTPRVADQFALEVTQVVPGDDRGIYVEGYRCSVRTHIRTSDALVWRYLSDLAHIERVARRVEPLTEAETKLQAALDRTLA